MDLRQEWLWNVEDIEGAACGQSIRSGITDNGWGEQLDREIDGRLVDDGRRTASTSAPNAECRAAAVRRLRRFVRPDRTRLWDDKGAEAARIREQQSQHGDQERTAHSDRWYTSRDSGIKKAVLARGNVGIELELAVLLAFSVLGQSTFARFEIETPVIRKIVKWFTMAALTLVLYWFVGHWALALTVAMGVVGTTFHFVWCRRNGIDPLRATPARKYYQLRGWTWPSAVE